MNQAVSSSKGPSVIGFILLGGPISGALVRDVRLANELAERGFDVHVWWAMDRSGQLPLHPKIRERWLFHGMRYTGFGRDLRDRIGKVMTATFADRNRIHVMQKRPKLLRKVMHGLMRQVCDGVEHDPALIEQFTNELNDTGVTHLLPMLEVLCPFAAAGARRARHAVNYLVTFQGYELYVTYAADIGREADFYARLVEVVNGSPWPAIAVSEHYIDRVVQDVGLARQQLRAIPPGVPVEVAMDRRLALDLVKRRFPQFRSDLPLVSYLGRRDVEKGIDLLLYAANILRARGLEFQLAVCGPTLFGSQYAYVCEQLSKDLRLPVIWARRLDDELRTALYLASHCLVYPSIHGEPFGMVPVEAMAHGTPAIVPDFGGVASVINANDQTGGLHFCVWDSGDLAEQIARLLEDRAMHQRLSRAAPRVAEYFSVQRLADRVLSHIGLPPRPDASVESPPRMQHTATQVAATR